MTPDITVVIRNGTEGLASLTLSPANGYYITLNGMGMDGQESWSLEYAESRFVHGGALVSAKLDHKSGVLGVYVEGATVAQMWSRIGALRSAVRQFHYYIDVTIGYGADSFTETYYCDPANSQVSDGVLNPFHITSTSPGADVVLTIPYKP